MYSILDLRYGRVLIQPSEFAGAALAPVYRRISASFGLRDVGAPQLQPRPVQLHLHGSLRDSEPGGDRVQEVLVAQEILQTMGLRAFTPMVVACPGCGRTTSTVFQELAQSIQSHLRYRMPEWRKQYLGVEEMTVAVMGCVVNGPGESKHANIGVSLPGTGERPVAPVYEDGEKTVTLKGERIAEEFQELVEAYVARKYERKEAP